MLAIAILIIIVVVVVVVVPQVFPLLLLLLLLLLLQSEKKCLETGSTLASGPRSLRRIHQGASGTISLRRPTSCMIACLLVASSRYGRGQPRGSWHFETARDARFCSASRVSRHSRTM